MHKKNASKRPIRITPHALIVFFSGTLIILLQAAYISFDLLLGTHQNTWYTVALYRKCLEQILLEAVILLIGSFLFDMTVRECRK